MSCDNSQNNNLTSVSLAARCAVEALEARLHLSYDDRGKISVIVEGGVASALAVELGQFQRDLISDGWTVSLHTNAPLMRDNENVWNNVDPLGNFHAIASTTTQYRNDLQTVKDMIASDAADGTLKSVVIVGHVTVPYSGGATAGFDSGYDGHGGRAMPTDQYYADADASPQSWGDSLVDVSYPFDSTDARGDSRLEFTWNKPNDGRFDAAYAPRWIDTVTVSGSPSDTFTLQYDGETATQHLPVGASVRDALAAVRTSKHREHITVVKQSTAQGDVYTLRVVAGGDGYGYEVEGQFATRQALRI
jgi:hypothetical protein